MSCTSCENCKEVSPAIPGCMGSLANAYVGAVALASASVVVRVEKLSTGATTDYKTATDLVGWVTFNTANFDVDSSFWQESAGLYKLSIINRFSNAPMEITQGAETADCVLFRIGPDDDSFSGLVTLEW